MEDKSSTTMVINIKESATPISKQIEQDSGSLNQIQKTLQIVIITMGISPIVKPILQSQHHVTGIIECAPHLQDKVKNKRLLYRIARHMYHKIRKTPLNLAALAREKRIPYYYMAEGSSGDLEDWVKSQNPDLIVVFYMSQLLRKNIFSIPRCGAINLHPSLLPKYRGPNPWFWKYYNHDLQSGVTVHYIDEGEDSGDIIYQESFDISLGMTFRQLYNKAIEDVGIKLLIRTLDNIAAGNAPRYPQIQTHSAQRARSIQPDEGSKLIEWEKWPVQRIWHFLRGASKWTNILPKMRGIYNGQNWEIGGYETCLTDRTNKPGKIYSEKGKIFLACKDGKIILRRQFSVKNFIVGLFLS